MKNMKSINKEEHIEIKNDEKNDKDKIDSPPTEDIVNKNIPNMDQFSRANTNKFDDKLLESQAFAPEKLEDLSQGDDFNFNFDQEEKKENTERKGSINFGTDSPIENKKFNFENKYANISLGSEIKKIEQNDYPNFDEVNNTNLNNNKINTNDSNMFHFEFGEESAKKQERKLSKDKESFNFNTTVNQKDGDEWDF